MNIVLIVKGRIYLPVTPPVIQADLPKSRAAIVYVIYSSSRTVMAAIDEAMNVRLKAMSQIYAKLHNARYYRAMVHTLHSSAMLGVQNRRSKAGCNGHLPSVPPADACVSSRTDPFPTPLPPSSELELRMSPCRLPSITLLLLILHGVELVMYSSAGHQNSSRGIAMYAQESGQCWASKNVIKS
jgi:hypothetical protein